jgi:IS5 family transposase
MMGPRQQGRSKLFYTEFNLSQRIRPDHPLRRVLAVVDFDFIRRKVKPLYGRRGHPSVDPVVLMKLMFLLFYEQVPSERALMDRLPERLDWLWFCGYDLDDPVPDHSVISKARKRWGLAVFSDLFRQILDQCIAAGLVDGRWIHADSSVLEANADKTKLRTVLQLTGQSLYRQLDQAGEPSAPEPAPVPPAAEGLAEPENLPLGTAVSPTDPEARLTRKNGQTILGYKDHRIVDDRCGIITSTLTTDAARADGQVLIPALDQHQFNTGQAVRLAMADKAYGTAENYQKLLERGVTPCIPHQGRRHLPGKFLHRDFVYDPNTDQYRCPAGQELTIFKQSPDGTRFYRAGRATCANCPLRPQCSDGRDGRQITRNAGQDYIDRADQGLEPGQRKYFLRRRQIRAEGSFADAANRHGYKRARWRGLMKMTIQNLLIAMMQNLRKLIKARFTTKDRGFAALKKCKSLISCHSG